MSKKIINETKVSLSGDSFKPPFVCEIRDLSSGGEYVILDSNNQFICEMPTLDRAEIVLSALNCKYGWYV